MKTKAVIAALVLMIGVVAARAGENHPVVKVSHQDGSDVFVVTYVGTQTGNVKLTLKDETGLAVMRQTVKVENGFLLPINLEGVDEGTYTLVIDDGSDRQIQTLKYSNEAPATYVHVTHLGDTRYLLSASHHGVEKINIKITDDNSNPVLEQQHLIDGSFAIVYDLKKVIGSPSFEVTDSAGRSVVIE